MKVKICGLCTEEAVFAAEEAGADFLGFVFYGKSPRHVLPEAVRDLTRHVHRAKTVGVFVDAAVDEVNVIAEFCGLDLVQLHGHEPPEYARAVRRPVIKAFRWGDDFSVEKANAYPAEIVLLDSFSKEAVGGTGERFRWREAAAETARLEKPLLVAGGVASGNVQEADELCRPYGVDVSGSLEIERQKSIEKIREFMAAAKGCGSEGAGSPVCRRERRLSDA